MGSSLPARQRLQGAALIAGCVGDHGNISILPISEGGQTANGRWDPPTNFGHFVGDLLGMRNPLSCHNTWRLLGAPGLAGRSPTHIALSRLNRPTT